MSALPNPEASQFQSEPKSEIRLVPPPITQAPNDVRRSIISSIFRRSTPGRDAIEQAKNQIRTSANQASTARTRELVEEGIAGQNESKKIGDDLARQTEGLADQLAIVTDAATSMKKTAEEHKMQLDEQERQETLDRMQRDRERLEAIPGELTALKRSDPMNVVSSTDIDKPPVDHFSRIIKPDGGQNMRSAADALGFGTPLLERTHGGSLLEHTPTAPPDYVPTAEELHNVAEDIAKHAPGAVTRRFFDVSEKGIGTELGRKMSFLERVREGIETKGRKFMTSVRDVFAPQRMGPPKTT